MLLPVQEPGPVPIPAPFMMIDAWTWIGAKRQLWSTDSLRVPSPDNSFSVPRRAGLPHKCSILDTSAS